MLLSEHIEDGKLSKEELIDKAHALEQEVSELQVECEDQSAEIAELQGMAVEEVDQCSFAERCFFAGHPSKWTGDNQMQAWLNFKILERL